MAQILYLCFLLAVANILLGLAMATTNKPQNTFQSISAPCSNAPSQSPSIGRKLGRHHSPTPSPSIAPKSEEKGHSSSEGSITNYHQRASVEAGGEVLGSKGQVHLLSHHHHSFDRSIAGGGVILGGLATTFFVAVFCYIRATRRHEFETNSECSH
ncbi:uncharacterized protein LOC130748643 [Lotus japonicus]|uniref:uncharacterized protein LOC130748643 n=1 Tax=Lotus japonicus TaxID=34305 RepID=UPI00258D5E3A|nr:uncharacterized protein LOC130748643 [Lotus japonicus]